MIEVAPWTNQGVQGINWLLFMDPDMVHKSHSIKNKYINKMIEIKIEVREREIEYPRHTTTIIYFKVI